MVSKARKRKRELEKRNQFSKMKNDSFDEGEDEYSVEDDNDGAMELGEEGNHHE